MFWSAQKQIQTHAHAHAHTHAHTHIRRRRRGSPGRVSDGETAQVDGRGETSLSLPLHRGEGERVEDDGEQQEEDDDVLLDALREGVRVVGTRVDELTTTTRGN